MSHITQEGASTIAYGWVLGLTTAFFIAAFTGWVINLYRGSAKEGLEAVGRMPLEEGR